VILADVYTYYAQLAWAIAVSFVVLVICLTTIWMNRK
jgi:hypothetical protein